MAQNTGKAFKADLSRWANLTQESLITLARRCCLRISENVVNDTPVDTGFLRGSWQPQIGGSAPFPKAGTVISLVVDGMELGDIYSMRNNAVYAMRIEYGFVGVDSLGRHYNQAGRYFVTRNIAMWPTIVNEEAAKL